MVKVQNVVDGIDLDDKEDRTKRWLCSGVLPGRADGATRQTFLCTRASNTDHPILAHVRKTVELDCVRSTIRTVDLRLTNHLFDLQFRESTRYAAESQTPVCPALLLHTAMDPLETPVSRRLAGVKNVIVVISGKGQF